MWGAGFARGRATLGAGSALLRRWGGIRCVKIGVSSSTSPQWLSSPRCRSFDRANRVEGLCGWGCVMGSCCAVLQVTESFFVAFDALGDGFEGGA